MPQELRVVCCFQCRKFQSDIVKKARKWTCKLCGVQQSLVKEYARGSGKECRLLVQRLSESSLQTDQMEQIVAEQMLSGQIVMPEIKHSIREESDRFVASHATFRNSSGNEGSKWDSFCANDDIDESDIATETINEKSVYDCRTNPKKENDNQKEKSKFDSRAYLSKTNVFSHKTSDKQSMLSPSLMLTCGIEQNPANSKLIPMVDFHQMNKQDKTQFKWQSSVATKFSAEPGNLNTDNAKPLFSFKSKKLAPLNASHVNETESHKRTYDTSKTSSPIMCFTKKTKWTDLSNTESGLRSQTDFKEISQNATPTQERQTNSPSSSKWNKYVLQTDEESDE